MRGAPIVLSSVILLAACGPAEPPPVTPTPPAEPPSAPSAAPSASAQASGYAGHGLESVPPEVLRKYAPTPLPSEITRDIQAILDVRAPTTGRLSPDGKSLYFGWSITGVRQVFRIDGPQRFPVQMTGGEDATTLSDITPDGKWLVLQRDRNGEENPGLYLQDPKGGPLVVIQHKPGIRTFYEFVTDDSRFLYYRANDKRKEGYTIYRYNLATKQSEVIFDQEGLWGLSDFRPDGRLLLSKAVGANMLEYYELAPGEKTPKPLFGQGEREDYVAVYGAGDGEILVQTPKLGGFRRLYVWKAGKLTPISPDLKHDVSSFTIDPARQRILYAVNEGGYTRLHALDAKTFKEIKLPAFPGADHVRAGASTHDGKLTTLSVDLGTSPAQSFVLDWKTNKLTQWHLPSAPEVDLRRFVRATLESYPARDGTPIPMFVRRPASCAKPCPVIVDFHGGPEGQSSAGYNTWAQIFVDAGFVVASPNVRGSDGYGKAWLHADDGPKRLDVITDIEDAAKYIRAHWGDGGKEPKVGVMGWSYGGYSTLAAMTMFAGAYDAGAEGVGFGNIITFLQNTAAYRRPLRISEYGDPEKDHDALVKLSPITHLDKLKAPLLLIQGANDPRVPVGEAVQFHDALAAKGVPTKMVIFADEGHGPSKRENQALSLGYMVQFFQEHLQGKKPAEAQKHPAHSP
ncbi:Acylamino-acid-releasing enzyme [Minicystis rosea]|nr:Acylamino-acid-releasing enzyme [Minicystis rosea]